MELGQLQTDLLPDPLDYRVYLPPCYDQLPDRRYPVLYYVHGSTYNDDQWDRIGADESANQLIAEGRTAPFMIVMPRDRVWTEPDEDSFGDAVIDDLVPWIDEHYRTLADRDHRAVGGLSRGAAWAIHMAITRWDLFGSLGAHSMVIFGYDMKFMRTWLDAIPVDSRPRILIDDGTGDRYLDQAKWFRRVLLDKGLEFDWRLYPGYHNEDYWEEHVEEYLLWFAEPWF